MEEETIAKLNKLDDFLKKSELSNNLPLFEVLQDINETLKVIAQKESPQTEMPDTHKVEIAGAELVTIKGEDGKSLTWDDLTDEQKAELRGEDGEDGKNYVLTSEDKKAIAKSIPVPIVEKIIEKTEVIREQPIVTNEIKEVAVADTAEDIRNKLELLNGDERLDRKAIKGLDEIELSLKKEIASIPRGGGAARRVFIPYRDDLSASCDGSNKTFYLSRAPLDDGTLMVYGTDFPVILRPTIDFTIANKTLTLASGVPAPNSGATLICTYFA